MSIEILGMICAAAIALIGFYLAYTQEDRRRRRIAMLVGFLFTITSGLVVVEEYFRRSSMATFTQTHERDWIVLKEAPVDAIEFEVMSADGMLSPGLLHYAHNIQLEIPSVDLGSAVPRTTSNSIDFSQIFTVANLSKRGRLGITVAKVTWRQEGDERTIERFQRVDCIASQFITTEILSQGDAGRGLHACSATVTIEPPTDAFRLVTIADWPKVSLTVVAPEQSRCAGICKNALLVSMRLVLRHGDTLTKSMIEISPFVLRSQPSAISQPEHTVTYALSGAALLELAKSHFLQSFGYRHRESFALTKGAFHALYRSLTSSSQQATVIDMVWTTNPTPDDDTLLNAVPPAKRKSAIALRAGEWCGFGDRAVCWYRFLMVEPTSR